MALVMFAAPAWALPDSAEMRVGGNITAESACSMSISNGGYIDFGQIAYASLNQSSTTNLGRTPRTVTVLCDSPKRLAISVLDNRADTVNPSRLSCGHCMGMGWTAAQRPVGFYGLDFLDDPIVDGVAQMLLFSNDLASWEMNSGLYLTPVARTPSSNGRKYVAAGAGPTAVIEATTLSIQFYADVRLEGRDTMQGLSGPTPIDGNAILELIYL